jgi:hypothetical protein
MGPDEVERRVRGGVERASGTRAPTDESPYEDHAWACMVEAVHEGAHDTSRAEGRALVEALREGIESRRRRAPQPTRAPPLPRLEEIARGISVSMFFAYYAALGRMRHN